MKQSILLLFLCFLSYTASAQLTNNGATIVIEQGAKLILKDGLTHQNAGTLTSSGELIVEGDLTNTGFINSTAATSAIIFAGSSPSLFTVGNTTLGTLKNEKENADIDLIGDLTISTILELDNAIVSKLNINDANLTLATNAIITGANANQFIATDGTGYLIKEVNSTGTFTFPVGNTTGRLTQLIADYSGTSFSNARLKVRVIPTAEPNLPAGVNDFINRRWEIVAENITDYQNLVAANYLRTDISGSETPIKGASYGNGEWSYLDGDRQASTLLGTVEILETSFTGSGFDATVFPVELYSFAATKVNESSARLDWSTASEENTAYFAVERSTDALNWAQIGQVAANGTSSANLEYTYLDDKIAPAVRRSGTVYYRLNIVDFDGQQEYSPIEDIQFEPLPDVLTVYPNPTADVLYVDNVEAVRSVIVYDSAGREVISTVGNQVDLHALKAGEYHVRLETLSSVTYRKVVKAN